MKTDFYQTKIELFESFVSDLINKKGQLSKYTFEEMYRCVYIIYKKNKYNAISLYYKCMSKLYENNIPSKKDIDIIRDIFMYMINQSKISLDKINSE